MRGILLGLLLANVLYLGWQFQLPDGSGDADPAPSVEVLSQNVASLRLLSEASQGQLIPYRGAAEPEPAPGSTTNAPLIASSIPAPAQFCAELGPFRDREDAEGFMVTNAGRFTMTMEERQAPAPSIYRVYLPPLSSRELAASTMQALRAAFASNGLTIDSFLISQGELVNGIALGLFAEHQNALNVQNQLQSLGYSVTVREEPKVNEEIWVNVSGVESQEIFLGHWAEIQLSRSYIRAGEKLC